MTVKDKYALTVFPIDQIPLLDSSNIIGNEQVVVNSKKLGSPARLPSSPEARIPFYGKATLTPAQMATLTTGVTIIPGFTPPDGIPRIWIVERFRMEKFAGGTYSNVSGSTFVLRINNTSGDILWGAIPGPGFLDNSAGGVERVAPPFTAAYGPQTAGSPIILHQNAGVSLAGGTGINVTVEVAGYSVYKDF